MGVTTVFRFRYFDRKAGRLVLADDWATAQAIRHIGGVVEPDSEREVESSEVSATAGLLIRPVVA